MDTTAHGVDLDETLARGVGALAGAAEGHWVAGHFGAALLAGVWLLRGGTLPEASVAALARRLADTIDADPTRYALPQAAPVSGTEPLVDSLREHAGELWHGAHGTIFATAALRAFEEQPGLATDPTLRGIVWLHRNAQDPDPARYYGIPDHTRVAIEAPEAPAAGLDAAQLTLDSLCEFDLVYPDQQIEGQRYFFAGEKLHLVTHAHALLQLEALGHPEIARCGLTAHRRQVVLTRQKPPGDLAPYASATSGPEDPDFWKRHGDPWHDIKFAHALSELLPPLSASQRERAETLLPMGWAALT